MGEAEVPGAPPAPTRGRQGLPRSSEAAAARGRAADQAPGRPGLRRQEEQAGPAVPVEKPGPRRGLSRQEEQRSTAAPSEQPVPREGMRQREQPVPRRGLGQPVPIAAAQQPLRRGLGERLPADQTTPGEQRTSGRNLGEQRPSGGEPATAPKKEGRKQGSRRPVLRRVVTIGLGAILAAALIVLAARGVTTLPGVPGFLDRYPGEYPLPSFVREGFPAWVRWTHYLNFFFMVLIVRSGLAVRWQKKPPAFFTPKRGGEKVSIYAWLHTSLDILWIANGIVFVTLLFLTDQWARIVPTSWKVFPNALSALLQYLTLDWPTEDGWANYNSLQQLMYFAVVFVAVPLAAITGLRMSRWWPRDAGVLNRVYPLRVARVIHFPVLVFFVLFVVVHVFLVFTTGMRRNLNHMFAGNAGDGWLGFWMFALGLAVVTAVTVLAKPVVLAQLAAPFGCVSSR